MNDKDRKILDKFTINFNIYCIITLTFLLFILICSIVCVDKLEELDKRFDNLNQLKQDSSLIEVNGELIDADDYYQADWKSYTPVKDSI